MQNLELVGGSNLLNITYHVELSYGASATDTNRNK